MASGKAKDPRFPEGTISMQKPHFEKCGFMMDKFFLGTINLDISPFGYELVKPCSSCHYVRWSPVMPPENFSFFKCCLWVSRKIGREIYPAYIYMPHPSTKPGFFQPENTIEVIAPYISNLHYGTIVELSATKDSVLFNNI